ncbi:hypothetical protein K3175_07320 [Qipengyuania sp. GH1]|uniref:hypothetical protein n=1 Tax=Qipengyuania aestuarii TaxID=2867241 RepID=UPI001C8757F6|nr:hypothetical protein [Qipengyuania aestuarii]MBX7535468.1 hypothetical protein [Qipengyuania aestuarii]
MRRASRIGTSIICTILAAGACSQALSNVIAYQQPFVAATLSPFAGSPLEKLVRTSAEINDQGAVIPNRASVEFAKQARLRDPLATEAAAILALSQPTSRARNEVISSLLELSRRGRFLSFAALQNSVETENMPGGILALDRMLRLYPGYSKQLMAPLMAYVEQDEALPAFEKVLSTRPEWRNAFFSASSGSEAGLHNLAVLRLSLGPDYPLSDASQNQLIAKLIAKGMWDEALSIRDVNIKRMGVDENPTLAWINEDPIFDWVFADKRQIFARPNPERDYLRIKVQPGQGGILAAKLLKLPRGARSLKYSHELQPSHDLRNFSLSLACAKSEKLIATTSLVRKEGQLNISQAQCEWVYITLVGRVFSTGLEVEGRFHQLQFL